MFAISRFAGVIALGLGIFGSSLLPSAADDYRGASRNFIHRGVHSVDFGGSRGDNRGFDTRSRMHDGPRFDHFARGMNVRNDDPRFGHDGDVWRVSNDDRFRANHPRHLQRLASGDFSTERGSGIAVQVGNRADYDFISNDAGASDSFRTAAGTYSVGYGDAGYVQDRPAPALMPRAKIIDVATMHDACSYENGVCVIRP